MSLKYNIRWHLAITFFSLFVFGSQATASKIDILIDASLDEQSLSTAKQLAYGIASSAGSESDVGLVIFDEVYQRGVDVSAADDAQVRNIQEILGNITSVDFSNLAVGIEKGISDLSTSGGLLLVLSNAEMGVPDETLRKKYQDWLSKVLLPDAANKSISVVLLKPQSAPTSEAIASMLLEHPDNRIIAYRDITDAVEKLSSVVAIASTSSFQNDAPSALVIHADTPASDVSVTDPIQTASNVTTGSTTTAAEISTEADSQSSLPEPLGGAEPSTEPASQATQPDQLEVTASTPDSDSIATGADTEELQEPLATVVQRFNERADIVIMFTLLFMVSAITLIAAVYRRKRNSKAQSSLMNANARSGNRQVSGRYLSPQHSLTTAIHKPAATAKSRSANSQHPGQRSSDTFDAIDNSILAASELVDDDRDFHSNFDEIPDNGTSESPTVLAQPVGSLIDEPVTKNTPPRSSRHETDTLIKPSANEDTTVVSPHSASDAQQFAIDPEEPEEDVQEGMTVLRPAVDASRSEKQSQVSYQDNTVPRPVVTPDNDDDQVKNDDSDELEKLRDLTKSRFETQV